MHEGTTALRVGDYNQQVVLELVRSTPGISRAELADRAGLTTQAIWKIVRRLSMDGLVVETGTTVPSAKGGRPTTGLRVNADAAYAIGVHIDRDQTAYAVLDLTGDVVARDRRPTPHTGPGQSVRQIDSVVTKLLTQRGIPRDKVLGIGLGVPGPLDPATGVVRSPGGMTGWGDVRLADTVAWRTGFAAKVENDAAAAAVGESWIGRARGVRSMLFVYAGFGLGAAVVIDGHVHRPARMSREFHHVPVEPSGPPCECGSRGCVGQYVSPAAVVDAVRAKRKRRTIEYADVCAAALAGESVERTVLVNAARMMSLGLLGVTNVLAPELVVLGGPALSAARPIYEAELDAAFERRRIYQRGEGVRVEFSDAGPEVVAVGAASLILHTTYAPKIVSARP